MKHLATLALVFSAVTLAACRATPQDIAANKAAVATGELVVVNEPMHVSGLEDCIARDLTVKYSYNSSFDINILVVRCPASDTTVEYRSGKTTKQVTTRDR